MSLIRWLRVLCVASLGMLGGGALAEPIATVEVTDGTVFVVRASGKRSIVAPGSALEVGDTISTEKDSYARLRFTDGGEMAVSPSSSLQVSDYHYQAHQPAQDNLALRLLKGGVRNLTGLIGKRGNQDAYRLEGGTATIGIRGTDFIARLCDADCAAHAGDAANSGGKEKALPAVDNPIVARLAGAEGQTRVTPLAGQSRPLNVGDPVYRGDTVDSSASGSATLVLSDETRVVLTAGSSYQLTSYRYNAKAPGSGSMVTDLLKGGLRVVTGLIGKHNPQQVKFETVTATVGIRGTVFDLASAPSDSDPQSYDPAPGDLQPGGQALFVSTREGETEVGSGASRRRVPSGQTVYVAAPGAPPMLLAELPRFLRNHPAPKPELLKIDMRELFGDDGRAMGESGLYVEVKDGRVALTQKNGEQIRIDAGETGFAGPEGRRLFKMGATPSFLGRDRYLRDLHVDPASCRAN